MKLLENLNFDNPEIVIMIDDDSTESFNREQRSKLDLKGQMLYEKVKSQFPEWDIVEGIEISDLFRLIFVWDNTGFWSYVWNPSKVQTYIFTEIDKAVQEKRDIRTKEVLESLQARFKKEDDVVMLEDDQPPGAYDIGEDIVHEWFLSNYEESPAPNMCIYKRELFKVQ